MGREVKRVALDFDWPVNEVWEGYLMPDRLAAPDCQACNGRGETSARLWVRASAHMLLLLDDDLREQERGRKMHPYFSEYYTTGYGTRPSADIHELGTGLAGRESGFLGHDSIDSFVATEKIVEAAGLDPKVWGICTECKGDGWIESYPGQSAEAQAWEHTEPPEGEGWQVWETVSEGSPISPVFSDREGLIQWLMSDANCWGISVPLTREQAESFTSVGWAPTMISTAQGGLVNGDQFIGSNGEA